MRGGERAGPIRGEGALLGSSFVTGVVDDEERLSDAVREDERRPCDEDGAVEETVALSARSRSTREEWELDRREEADDLGGLDEEERVWDGEQTSEPGV